MKKGLRKLILSGTALAAVAATLGTSTYAWYTANETVSATNINGASAGATDASIFISKNHSAWSSTVDMAGTWDHDANTETAEVPFVSTASLLPVEYNATDGKFYNLGTAAVTGYTVDTAVTSSTFKTDGSLYIRTGAGTTADPYVYTRVTSGSFDDEAVYCKATTDDYSAGVERTVAAGAATEFTLYFRTSRIADSSPAPTVYLKNITLTNTTPTSSTGAYVPADNLYYGKDNGFGVDTQQATYGVDFTKALKMVINSNAATAGLQDTTDASYHAQNVNGKALDLSAFQNTKEGIETNLTGTADALAYYNNIMNTNLTYAMDTQVKEVIDAKNTYSGANNQTGRDEITLGTLKRDTNYITVTFQIYLDGWDTYCYDACKGQSFKINLEFTSDVKEALTYAE